MKIAEQEDADLYITTSRRTPPGSVETLKYIASHSSARRYLIASESDFNPIPAMLGFSNEIFCTEDLGKHGIRDVTGGHRAVLLRVGHKKGSKIFQDATA